VDRVVEREDRDAPLHLVVSEDARERLDLLLPDLAGGDEREARDGARQTDDRERSAELHDREAAEVDLRRQLRQIALEVRREETREALRLHRAARVEVVVAGHDRDVLGRHPQLVGDETEHGLELLLEREVREVAGDDDVVDLRRRDGAGDGLHMRRAMLVLTLDAQVDEAGEPLVEEAASSDALEREHMEVREVSDAHIA